uniref:vesicle-fusing ATPase-like isoform X3 n=1 Tax=Monopterus albus TaxID=43700 RepID=UPI0009B41BB1|nr:vesicle-fusing ATPase-like isoform X3 [Monopterus albus]
MFCAFFSVVNNYIIEKSRQCISTMTAEIDFLRKSVDSKPYDTDRMACNFIQCFNNQVFSVGQQLWFGYCDTLFSICIKDIEAMDSCILPKSGKASGRKNKIETGLLLVTSVVIFKKSEMSSINLVGTGRFPIISLDWNLEKGQACPVQPVGSPTCTASSTPAL